MYVFSTFVSATILYLSCESGIVPANENNITDTTIKDSLIGLLFTNSNKKTKINFKYLNI